MLPWLSKEELDDMCFPLTSAAAQIRYLRREGLSVSTKPGGKPLLMRSELERVKGANRFDGQPAHTGTARPNRAALMEVIQGGKRGPQTQGR